MFRYCKTKQFQRKVGTLHPPPLTFKHKTFGCQKISEAQKSFSKKCFGTVRQKQFRRRIIIFLLSLSHKIFRNRKFSETQKGFSKKFVGTVRQKLSTENLNTVSLPLPLPPYLKTFSIPKFNETQ